jgi:hypothetical protein
MPKVFAKFLCGFDPINGGGSVSIRGLEVSRLLDDFLQKDRKGEVTNCNGSLDPLDQKMSGTKRS